MTVPASIQAVAQTWSSYYGDHQAVSVVIKYVHLAGTMIGGGTAFWLDRAVLAAVRQGGDTRLALLHQLRGSHRVVVPSLMAVALSGVAMMAADLELFLNSRLFALKVGLVVLLLINGSLLVAAEAAAMRQNGESWSRLRVVATVSIVLWLSTLMAGAWLTVAA